MKYIGQHIYDLVSKFRNDVFFECDTVTFTSASADDPIVKILNTTNDDQAAQLVFEKLRDDNAVASGQNLGEIWFLGQDSAQNTQRYAYINGEIDVSTGGEESGSLTLGVASHAGNNGAGLILVGGSESAEIDITVGKGANSVVTIPGNIDLAGDIDVDGTLETDALTIGGTNIITGSLITTLGTISAGVWQGTAINQTYLAGQSGTNTGDETADSINALDITEVGTISDGRWQGTAIASAYLDADTAHLSGSQTFTGNKNFTGGASVFSSATADSPIVKLLNTTDDDQAARLIFEKLRDDDAVASGQNLGEIWFTGQDANQNTEDYAFIIGEIDVSTHGQESGVLRLGVTSHDGSDRGGLTLTGGSEATEVDVEIGRGAASVTTVAGDLTITGSDLTFDSVALTAIQTSGESFVDNDTSVMTSAAIDDKINTKYARSTISFTGQGSMLSSGNWVTTGQGGISNHSWNQDMGVNTETNGTSAGSLAKQYGHMGIRVPYACVIENIYAAIRNSSGNRQATVGLFCARAADGTTAVDWGTTDATEPILQIHADANNEGGSYQNRPTHAEASVDVIMAAGDVFYPAMKLTGVTSGGNTDTVLASFTVGIKTLIA